MVIFIVGWMGNSLIKQAKRELKSEGYRWSVKSVTPYNIIVAEEKSGTEGERNRIEYSVLEEEWRTYVLRRNNPKHLVAVYDLLTDKESLCSGSSEASVVIQHIPYRLTDLGSLSFLEGMYIIRCVLEGYRVLASSGISFYLLDEACICFTHLGSCKFWINENLHLSKPHPNRIVPEDSFIASLLEIVEPRIDYFQERYLELKEQVPVLTLAATLHLVAHFPNLTTGISSISAMSQHSSPKSLAREFKSVNPAKASENKMSISKYKQSTRRKVRGEGTVKEELSEFHLACKKNNEPKKLSLSFKGGHKKEFDFRSGVEKGERKFQFASPRKVNNITTLQMSSIDSSRSNIHLKNMCAFPFYKPSDR